MDIMDIYAFCISLRQFHQVAGTENISLWLASQKESPGHGGHGDAEVNQGESDRFIEQWIAYIMVSFRFSRKKQTTLTVIVQ